MIARDYLHTLRLEPSRNRPGPTINSYREKLPTLLLTLAWRSYIHPLCYGAKKPDVCVSPPIGAKHSSYNESARRTQTLGTTFSPSPHQTIRIHAPGFVSRFLNLIAPLVALGDREPRPFPETDKLFIGL